MVGRFAAMYSRFLSLSELTIFKVVTLPFFSIVRRILHRHTLGGGEEGGQDQQRHDEAQHGGGKRGGDGHDRPLDGLGDLRSLDRLSGPRF